MPIQPPDPQNEGVCLAHIRQLVEAEDVLFGPHAVNAMEQEILRFTVEDVFEAIRTGEILENYPEAARGSCCLINGETTRHRPIHVICTSTRKPLFIITVYEPKPPSFVTPSQRSTQR